VSLINQTSDGGEGVEAGPRQSIERTVPNGIGIFYDAAGRPGPAGAPGAPGAAAKGARRLGARFVAGFTAGRPSVVAARRLRLPLYASERARLRVTVRRGRRTVGRFTRRVGPGTATVTWRRALRPGDYRLRVTATTRRGARATDTATLRVRRRLR